MPIKKNTDLLTTGKNLYWKVNTPALLNEILINNQVAILAKPIAIFAAILHEVGERAAEINDPKLNALMCRLAIYAESDPYSVEYNAEKTETTINAFY